MDRPIIYDQSQGRDYDVLQGWRANLIALGQSVGDILGGVSTVVTGLAATPTTPASLTINIAAGDVYQLAAIDGTAYGSLAADAAQTMQQGFALAQQVALNTSGLSSGQSRWALVQANFSQQDEIPGDDPNGGVLAYLNVSNPTGQPFSGPNNSGQAQNTRRQAVCVISVIFGNVATTGSEAPPNPSPSCVPLYLIDLAFGQTTIAANQILIAGPSVGNNVPNNYPRAPFLAGLLAQHHTGAAGQAPQIDLTAEVRNKLPLANLPGSSAPAGGGLSVVQTFAGNPNGSVAGNAGVAGVSAPDIVWDTTDKVWYVCTTSGTAATAVWMQFGGNLATISASATLSSAQAGVILVNAAAGNVTLTLPPAATLARLTYSFVRIDNSSSTVTITPVGQDSVDGIGAFTLPIHGASRVIVADGVSAWNSTAGLVYSPVRLVTGTNYTYQTTDRGQTIRRSNSGAAMADTLPSGGTSGFQNGWWVEVINSDTAAQLTISGPVDNSTSVNVAPLQSQTINADGTATGAYWSGKGAAYGHGGCRLSVASTTSVKLSPYAIGLLLLNGVAQPVPSAGIVATNASLAASTLYYAYAQMVSGSMALNLSTTGHVTSASGVEVKNGDATQTLVGMVFTDANTHFNDTPVLRNCANWFNRANKSVSGSSPTASTTSTTAVELSASARVEISLWADESPALIASNSVNVSVAGDTAALTMGVDGVSNGIGSTTTSAGANQQEPAIVVFSGNLAEGHHVFSPFGQVTSGATANFSVAINGITRG
jgi:hypothetical protein